MIIKTVYALLSKYTSFCMDFSWENYRKDIWWYYLPKGLEHTLVLYVIAGIIIPIIIQKAIDRLKKMKFQHFNYLRKS